MGARGPAPKPTALKRLQGNPGKRALPAGEPQPAAGGVPAVPRWLSEEGKREWRRLAGRLWRAGLLTEADHDGLAMYCETFATWKRAEAQVRAKGEVVRTAGGNVIQNPYLSIANRAKRDALVLAREFGMTPAARTRISVDGGEEEPSVADLLFGLVDMAGGVDDGG